MTSLWAWIAGCVVLLASGCGSTEQNLALGVGAAAVLGGQAPNNEIEQIYYLGVFDPEDQLPPSVYRVRVRGQASFYSNTRFASGWVKASLVDSLGSSVSFAKAATEQAGAEFLGADQASFSKGDNLLTEGVGGDRRLVVFGPEGFREAPKDHRLVVVMGASPEKFFQAVDESLGAVADFRMEQRAAEYLVAIGQAEATAAAQEALAKETVAALKAEEGK